MKYNQCLVVGTLASLCFLPGVVAAQCSQRLIAADARDNDHLGRSLALHGSLVVVGCEHDEVPRADSAGSAYLYERQGTTWNFIQRIVDIDPGTGQQFGASVAVKNGLIAVAADKDHSPTNNYVGSIQFFRRSPSGWAFWSRVFPSDGETGERFGYSMDMDGEVVVASSPWADTTAGAEAGKAYVFRHTPGAAWVEEAKLTASDALPDSNFGWSVSVSGDTALVGTPQTGANLGRGCAYVFQYENGVWTEQAKLQPDEELDYGYFGMAVFLDGDRAIIGRPNRGRAAFVFDRQGTTWVQDGRLLANDTELGDAFGYAVSYHEGTALVGAVQHSDPGDQTGAVYAFEKSGSEWVETRKYILESAPDQASFGYALAVDSENLVISCPNDTVGTHEDAGSVHVYPSPTFYESWCTCETGPCSNDDQNAGCDNSTGVGARTEVCGTGSVTRDDLVFTTELLPPNQNCALFMGTATTPVPFGDGLGCLDNNGVGLFRFSIQASDGLGRVETGPGFVQYSHAHFAPAGWIQPGQSWNFQVRYRDPSGPCGSSFNLSQALTVAFTP